MLAANLLDFLYISSPPFCRQMDLSAAFALARLCSYKYSRAAVGIAHRRFEVVFLVAVVALAISLFASRAICLIV